MVENFWYVVKETLFIKKIITLKLVFYELLSFKPKNLTSGNLTSKILGNSFNPLLRNSDYLARAS